MTKVAVYGGGIVAMLLAMVFKKQGIDVKLWRPSFVQSDVENKRVFALNQAAINCLSELDIRFSSDSEFVKSVQKMLVWDAITGSSICFDAADVGSYQLTQIVHEHFLWQQIWDKLKEVGISVIDLSPGQECCQVEEKWHIQDGLSSADFLCIADGARSKLRQQLHVACEYYSYHQTALVAQVKVAREMDGIAFQAFGPRGPLAFLPLSSPNQYSIVWSLDTDVAKAYLNLTESELKQAMGLALNQHLGAIEEIQGLKSYPLHMLHAKQYVGKNWLLAGDAAHHFHPLAGLGLNMGIGDVACLKRLMQNQTEFAKTLLTYQRERRAALEPIIVGMKLIKNCFGIQQGFWVKLRSLGMDWLNHQGMLKKLMVSMIQNI
jgi:2-octaprenylphenol hydroxylase